MATNIEGGYIKLYRKFFTNKFWQDARGYSRSEAWLWLLQRAYYGSKPTDIEWSGTTQKVARGQILTTYRNLAKEFGWQVAKVQRYLQTLSNEGMITYNSLSDTPTDTPTDTPQAVCGTLISICNYDIYNPIVEAENEGYDTQADTPTDTYKEEDIKKKINKHTQVEFCEEGVWGRNRIFTVVCRGQKIACSAAGMYERWQVLPEWLALYAPDVLSLRHQLTLSQFIDLCAFVDIYDISRILVAMGNSTTIRTKRSVYHTFMRWLETDKERIGRNEAKQGKYFHRGAYVACKELGIVSINEFYHDKQKQK